MVTGFHIYSTSLLSISCICSSNFPSSKKVGLNQIVSQNVKLSEKHTYFFISLTPLICFDKLIGL